MPGKKLSLKNEPWSKETTQKSKDAGRFVAERDSRGNVKRTPELEAEVLMRISEGEPLTQICRDDEMPSRRVVLKWVQTEPDFKKRYDEAREIQVDAMLDEMIEIVDDGTNDWMLRELSKGRVKMDVNKEHINRSRLRFEARKWWIGMMMPHKYSEKLRVETTGKDGKDLIPADQMAPERLLSLAHTLAFTFSAGSMVKSEETLTISQAENGPPSTDDKEKS